MNKITLLDTPYAKAKNLSSKIPNAAKFLIQNWPVVVVQGTHMRDIQETKLFSSTPISRLFQDLVSANKLNNFLFVNLTRFGKDFPELLAVDDLVIDGKVATPPLPAQLQKCWINISSISSIKDSYNGSMQITDALVLASYIVRAALCSTYNDTDMWLNPRLAAYVIESYAGTIGHVLKQAYGLTYEEDKFVQTLLAAYYAQLLGGSASSLDMPPLLLRCGFLGSANEIIARLKTCEPHRTPGSYYTPAVICKLLAKVGPPRMKNIQDSQLYRFISNSVTDSGTMLFAADYPPYWVWMMLRIMSGSKNPVMSNVIKLYPSMKKSLNAFCEEFINSRVLLEKLTRG